VVSLDLSRALPPRAYLYLSAFMPGLFIEFSILLANPNLARQLVLRTQEGFGFGPYLTLFVGLFLAFVIGNALMLFAWFIQLVVERAYRIGLFLWEQFESHVLLPRLTKLSQRQGWTPPSWLFALHTRTVKNVQRVHSTVPTDDYLWWEALAKQLLLKRYGLSESDLPPASFRPLQEVLTDPTPEEIRGSILVSASQATGWAALIASYFAPALRTRWYISFALFLIAYGLLHDYTVAKSLQDPDLGDTLRLRAVLREFPKIRSAGPAQPPSENHANKGEEA
jgi:hypothetical protein